jgi:hypothetical protein
MIGEVQVLLWAMVRGARKPDKVKFDYWKTLAVTDRWIKGVSHYRGNIGSNSIFNYLVDHTMDVDQMDNVYFFRKPGKMLDDGVVDDMLLRLGIGVER